MQSPAVQAFASMATSLKGHLLWGSSLAASPLQGFSNFALSLLSQHLQDI